MEKAPIFSTPKTEADYEAEVDFYLAESKRLQQSMADDRAEILSLQEETRALLNNLMARFP
jgi:hypothetical protein